MKIGVMDSGIGGLTTLNTMMEICGGDFIFVRDKKAPYGDKSDDFVLERTFKAVSLLKSLGSQVIVLACNTATGVAIGKLRASDPTFEYIGVEPAVKPALLSCEKIAVALTPVAARQEKFLKLIEEYRHRIKLVTIPHLASAIEETFFDARLFECASELYLSCKGCDGLVLGCTHYIFLKEQLRLLDGKLKLFDGNEGVARRLLGITGRMGPPSVRFELME